MSRDKQLVKAVNDFRIMRQDQLQQLFFPSKNTAQKRLQLLWQHSFLQRDFLLVKGGIQNSQIVYMIDKRGIELLRREFGYTDEQLRRPSRTQFSDRFLHHTLGIGDVRIAVMQACQTHGLTLRTWHDEKKLKEDYDHVPVGKRLVAVLPDAYFSIYMPQAQGDMHFFLEYDRGDEGRAFFKRKMSALRAYFDDEQCRNRYGTTMIRVLTVAEGGVRRLENLRATTQAVGGGHQFYFARSDQVTRQGVLTAPIWLPAHQDRLTALYYP